LLALFAAPLTADEAPLPTTSTAGSPADRAQAVSPSAEALEADAYTVHGKRPSSSATFGQRDLLDVPYSVGTVDRVTIEDQRAYRQREVLKNEPSFNLSLGYIGEDGTSLRGFSQASWNTFGNRRIDGMPAAFARGEYVSIENKEAVEVVKGAAGLRYGIAAPGGVINYVRKKPTDRTRAGLSVDADSFGRLNTTVDVGGPINEALGYRIVGTQEKIDHLTDYFEGERTLTSALWAWKVRPGFDLDLALDRTFYRAGLEGIIPISINGKVFTDLPKTFSPYGPNTRWEADSMVYSFGGRLSLSDGWSLASRSQVSDTKTSSNMYGYIKNIQDNGDVTLDEYSSGSRNERAFAQQGQVEGKFSTGALEHDLVAGFSWNRRSTFDVIQYFGGTRLSANLYNWPPAGNITTNAPALRNGHMTSSSDEWGAFLTDFIALTDWLELMGGLRYTNLLVQTFNNTYQNPNRYRAWAVSPSFAVTLKPGNNTSVFVLYTEGLEQGGTAGATATNANEVLPPKRTRQAELGAKHRSGALDADTAVFYAEQPIEFTDNSNTFVQSGKAVHTGVEANLAWRAAGPLTLRGGGMLLSARQESTGTPTRDGKRPGRDPSAQGNAGLDLDLGAWLQGLGFHTTVFAVSERPLDNIELYFFDPYTRWDLGLKYAFKAGAADCVLRLNVENVDDKSYLYGGAHYGSTFGGWANWGNPRLFTLSLDAKY
jgi:iron complex outermembrane receptor protein